MIFFELACHKKNGKCSNGPYIYDVHTEQRWEVLKVVMCSWILLFLNNRFIVDFYRWRGWKGHKTNVFCEYHTHNYKGTSVVFRASNLFQIHNHIQDGEFKVLLKLVAHCYKFS